MILHPGILRAICADPADVGLRLVMADWLEELGDAESLAKSEFVRVQVELARIFADTPDLETQRYRQNWPNRSRELLGRVGNLRHREQELFWAARGQQFEWLGAAHRLTVAGVEWMKYLPWFRRGFVEVVSCSSDQWLEHGPAVVAAQPVREVRLSEKRPVKSEGKEDYRWARGRNRANEPSWDIPVPLFASRGYGSEAHAHAGLSQACIRWAREQAGLPTDLPSAAVSR